MYDLDVAYHMVALRLPLLIRIVIYCRGQGISPGCYDYDPSPLSWDTKGNRTKRTS